MPQFGASFTLINYALRAVNYAPRGVNYAPNIFLIQATEYEFWRDKIHSKKRAQPFYFTSYFRLPSAL